MLKMESSVKPFIKKFKIDDRFYIYDVNSNKFFKVDEIVYTLIDKEGDPDKLNGLKSKFQDHEIEKAQKNIDEIKRKGYFSSHRPEITFFHTRTGDNFKNDLKDVLDNKLNRITLVSTEKCNLRCRYCAYSGKYIYHRKHSKKDMDTGTMKTAVDFYFSHSSKKDEKNISIYGGEPLINFGLIKECVDYVKNKYAVPTNYNMTSNGILLDEDKIKFLVENQFSILISIDGPEEIHNRYRVFKNGKGTFDPLIRNLKAIKSMYPGYYKSKIRFNIVLAPPFHFDKINEFIYETDVKPAGIKFNYVNKNFTTFFNQFSSAQMESFKYSRINNLESFHSKLVRGEEPNAVEKNMFRDKFLYIHRRNMDKLAPKYPPNGQCILGERVLLINTDGSFNFCSRMSDVFNLGNIYSGFDYKRIEKIYFNLDNFFRVKCYGCWAIRFCMKCVRDINKNGQLDEEVFELFCSKKKNAVLNEIKDYITIRENNYHALDYLEEVILS